MRALALASVLVAACGPAVSTHGSDSTFDEDLGPRAKAEPVATAPVEPSRPVAPVGTGARTGSIARDRLNAVLDQGPAAILGQVEVAPQLTGDRFVGWQLVQVLDRASPLAALDLAPGDVLLAINGKPLARPDQLQALWDSLRTAPTIEATLWRGKAQFTIAFAVEAPASDVKAAR